MSKPTILYATRALESPPREGGFVVLKDLAQEITKRKQIQPYFFSSEALDDTGSIKKEKVFTHTGWDKKLRRQFLSGMRKTSSRYDIVHTAHIPTRANSRLMKLAIRKARKSGTKFVQTITGLPDINMSPEQLKPLLWGDELVCQSPQVAERIAALGRRARYIQPAVAPARIALSASRQKQTRAQLSAAQHIVIFPGEFDRLGVDSHFAEALEVLFSELPDSLVVLACRFDTHGTGKELAKRFPDNVISVGSTEDIVGLIEAADMTIYPVTKMDSKFQPPLVLIESLQLGTPVLVSDLVDIANSDSAVSYPHTLSWREVGKRMADTLKKTNAKAKKTRNDFSSMVDAYQKVYESLLSKNQ